MTVFQRTALADTTLGGQQIKAGQRVGLFYRSANFDEHVFDAPERFDIRRGPNPHLGFGGTGTHYCLGANLARLEIDLMFNAIADALPDIRQAGQPERLRSGWLNGTSTITCTSTGSMILLPSASRQSQLRPPAAAPLCPELAAPLGVCPSSQVARCAGGRARWRL